MPSRSVISLFETVPRLSLSFLRRAKRDCVAFYADRTGEEWPLTMGDAVLLFSASTAIDLSSWTVSETRLASTSEALDKFYFLSAWDLIWPVWKLDPLTFWEGFAWEGFLPSADGWN